MAKFELLTDGMNYKGTFYTKSSLVDFDDDIDVKGLEEDGHIGAEGTLKKHDEEVAKREEEQREFRAEQQAREDEEAARRFAEHQERVSGGGLPNDFGKRPRRDDSEDKGDDKSDKSEGNPNVSSQDGPKTTERVNTRRR